MSRAQRNRNLIPAVLVLMLGVGIGAILGKTCPGIVNIFESGTEEEMEIAKSERRRTFQFRSQESMAAGWREVSQNGLSEYLAYVAEMSPEEFEEAADDLRISEAAADYQFLLFSTWGASDPRAALDYSRRFHRSPEVDTMIYQGWAASDPEGLFGYYKNNPVKVESERNMPPGSGYSYGYICKVPAITAELARSHPELLEHWEKRRSWRKPSDALNDDAVDDREGDE